MGATVSASRTMSIKNDEPNKPLTLGHLKALVNLAVQDGYPDDAVVTSPTANTGVVTLSIREGSA